LDVVGSEFVNNTANNGGAFYIDGILDVVGSEFVNNTANNGGAIYIDGYGEVNFNRIVGNTAANGGAIYNCLYSFVDATNNWWGSNTNPKDIPNLIAGDVDDVYADPWIVLTIAADPTTINNLDTSQVTVDLNHNSDNTDISGQGLPEGIPVTFTATNGTMNPTSSSTVNGVAISTFTANKPGIATVTATVDLQTVSVDININKTQTQLSVSDTAGVNNETINLTATLTDTNSNPVIGKEITFQVNGSTVGTATTDANGIATLTYTITQNTGVYDITTIFSGDSEYLDCDGIGFISVDPSAGLYLNITASNYNPTVGDLFIITFKLGNYGPDTAENVTVNFQIPEGMEFLGITVDSGTWNYETSTRTVTWTLDNVPVGDPYLYLTVKAIKSGTYSITPSITSDTYNWNTYVPTLTINIREATHSDDPVNEAKAATKTVPMQKTGTNIYYLLLATLLTISGLITTKRK
jgi:uncharacterized repeat protein (TIGR01451 family)